MKKTITTTATIYVHNYENLAIGPKEFREEVKSRAEDLQRDTDHFSEWLTYTKDLSPGEVFNLTEEKRAKLLQEYETQCFEDATEELLEDFWREHEVEVEIEVES